MDETRDMQEDLNADYREMSSDAEREDEALAWAEGAISGSGLVVSLTEEESLRRLRKTLASLEQDLGPDHPDALNARHRLAHRLRAQGELGQALGLFQASAEGWSRALGPDSAEALRARSSLANCYYAAGRYDDAIRQFAQVLEARERALGPDHPETLRSRGSLANSHRAAGRPQEALGRHRGLLPDRERVLGPDHPSTQATRKNLASTQAELGLDQGQDEDRRDLGIRGTQG